MSVRKIVVDSSADPFSWADSSIGCACLKVITDQKEYLDNGELNTFAMAQDLLSYSGRSGTACPSPEDFLEAFGEADEVFCITITSQLSGSFNAARIAAEQYMEKNPCRKVLVIDSRSAGPELRLLAEKVQALLDQECTFEQIQKEIAAYQEKTGLIFMLESMKNLANNGRVSPLVAKMAGILGIRLIGKASDEGTLAPLEKARGREKALSCLITQLQKLSFGGQKIHIAHCFNEEAAQSLQKQLRTLYPHCRIALYPLGGLCSFYAEKGGILIGFEKK